MPGKYLCATALFLLFVGCKQPAPQPCDDHYIKAHNYLMALDLDNSEREYEFAAQQDPKNAYAYFGKGSVWEFRGDAKRAILFFDTALQMQPSFAIAYYNRAHCYADLGQYKKGVDDLDELVKLVPHFFLGYRSRAIYKQYIEDYTGSLADNSECIALNPTCAQAYSSRATCYAHFKDYKRALQDIEKVLEFENDNVTAVERKGFYEYMLGDREHACGDFRTASDKGDSIATHNLEKYCK